MTARRWGCWPRPVASQASIRWRRPFDIRRRRAPPAARSASNGAAHLHMDAVQGDDETTDGSRLGVQFRLMLSCAPAGQPDSRLSAAIPRAASRRTTAPRPASWLSSADVMSSKAAGGVVNWWGWHRMQGVRGSNPLGSTQVSGPLRPRPATRAAALLRRVHPITAVDVQRKMCAAWTSRSRAPARPSALRSAATALPSPRSTGRPGAGRQAAGTCR
jgi:hypothetical protein